MIKLGCNAIIKGLSRERKKHLNKLWRTDFQGKKGKVVGVLTNSKGEDQGFRIRFPLVKVPINENGLRASRENFEYPFYDSEVALLSEELVFPKVRESSRRTKLGRNASINAVRRLRRKGYRVNELADKFNVSLRTIGRWLKI